MIAQFLFASLLLRKKKKNAMVDASRKMASFERGMTHVFMLRIDGQFTDYPWKRVIFHYQTVVIIPNHQIV